jgi:hypothetical protein
MSRHPPISPARHAQGLALYRTGQSLQSLFKVLNDIEAMHEQPNLTDEQHDEIQAAPSGVMLGFGDGLIEDIRTLATSVRRGQRA